MAKKNRFFIVVFLFSVLCVTAVHAKPFYENKVIKLIVSTKPGGGYDAYGRLVGMFMQKYLPGSTIIVKNIPGAGHIIGCNELYFSKPNGLTFGTFQRALILTQAVGLKGVKFDQTRMSWLGSASSEPYCFIVSTQGGFKKLDDVLKADRVLVSSAGVGSQSYITPILFSKMLNLKNIKVTTGYMGGEGELAMMRGEVDGQFGSWIALKSFVEEGHAVPVMFISKERIKGYENVTLLKDIITEEKYRPVVDLFHSLSVLGRPFAGPPDIPAEKLKVLRDAFARALRDKELLNRAQKSGQVIDYSTGEEASNLIKSVLNIPPDLLEILKQAYGVK